MQHVRKIGGTQIVRSAARSADREEVMGGRRAWGLMAGQRAGTGTNRKASPALPVEQRCARGKAETDAALVGHRGTWLCGCGPAKPLGRGGAGG